MLRNQLKGDYPAPRHTQPFSQWVRPIGRVAAVEAFIRVYGYKSDEIQGHNPYQDKRINAPIYPFILAPHPAAPTRINRITLFRGYPVIRSAVRRRLVVTE